MRKLRLTKVLKCVCVSLLVLSLSSCSIIKDAKDDFWDYLRSPAVLTVEVDGVTYKNSFTTGMMTNNITPKGENFKVGDVLFNGKPSSESNHEFFRVDFDKYDLIQQFGAGNPYCAIDQWDEAQAYYADYDNYLYYCYLRTRDSYDNIDRINITNIDYDKFKEFMDWAENQHKYVITVTANSKSPNVKYHYIPYPDKKKCPIIQFYRDSKDGLFRSQTTKYDFYVVDGKLIYSFFYAVDTEEIAAVDVPKEFADYFLNVLNEQVFSKELSVFQ